MAGNKGSEIGILHALAHRFNWFKGRVISFTDSAGHTIIGFQCDKCHVVEGCADITDMIDRELAARRKGSSDVSA